MPSFVFNIAKALPALDFPNDTIRFALVDDGFVGDPDADTLTAALEGQENAGATYARKVLGSKTATVDDTANERRMDAADQVYAGADFGIVKGGIAYKDVAGDDSSDATAIPLAYCELTAPVTTNGGDFTFQFGADGVLKAT